MPPAASAPNLNTLWARVLVDELARAGLDQVVISPGSRSAALVFQFALHPDIADHSVVDERAAAFFALGMARASGRPVALVCTTGTAVANYFPAVCEAARDRIPLLLLTAARPPQDHDCGASQVMDQTRLFGVHVRGFHALGQPALEATKIAALRQRVALAWAQTIGPEPGPVHLDIMFSKPLEPVQVAPDHADFVPDTLPQALADSVAGRADAAPWLRVTAPSPAASDDSLQRLHQLLNTSRRPLLIAGADPRGSDRRRSIRNFAERFGIPVLAEPASALRHWSERGDHVLSCLELGPVEWPAERPDLILRTGAAPLNWNLERRLRDAAGTIQVVISESPALADPEHGACEQIVCNPADLFERLARLDPGPIELRAGWLSKLQHADQRILEVLDRELDDRAANWSAPGIWHRLGQWLPDDAALLCSSSMVVRDLDSYMSACWRDLEVHFNRGLNGIDGVIATAMGIAAARKARRIAEPTVLVIGDVALRHDLGALPMAAELGLDLTVVVIDNDGGEIFDYLPSVGFGDIHERHFLTRRREPLAAMIPRAIELHETSDFAGFEQAFTASLQTPGLQLIRAATRRDADQRIRARIRAAVAAAVAPERSSDGQ
jgi:2-succinyl-5-enolpyruvyl-6-hydroxy-3-cyclohexene-1-carboxylate synthase